MAIFQRHLNFGFNRSDLIAAVQSWVIGELFQICAPGGHYFSALSVDNQFNPQKFTEFATRVTNTVYMHLIGNKTLDGSCSDMECSLALKAKGIFRSVRDNMIDADLVSLMNYGHVNDAISLQLTRDNRQSREEALKYIENLVTEHSKHAGG